MWRKLVRSSADIIVIDEALLPQPIDSGLAILNDLPERPITVVVHGDDSPEEHASLVTYGADVVLYSGLSTRRLADAIEATVESRRQLQTKDRYERRGSVQPSISDFVSESSAMQIFMEETRQVIASDSTLLVLGETGVGKEHLARAIHAESPRSAGPFVTVNAATLPEQLLESELFGHEQGAFTGAVRTRRGAFELAHRGTIFLDEIGELPLHLQAKLLRVLQDYEIRPLGSETSVWIDVRVIAASNRNLEHESRQGAFRSDLFYRLSVVALTVPPLRKRLEDIPRLTDGFLERYVQRSNREIAGIQDDVVRALCLYDWPGNVRELMNVIERATLLCRTERITLSDLPSIFEELLSSDEGSPPTEGLPEAWKRMTLPQVREQVLQQTERAYLSMVLRESQGRIARAAARAGIHPRGLYDKMKQLGLRKEDFKRRPAPEQA
ncbi:MAG: sigma-54 dependent transcriptional regulator [bacterium]